MGMMASLKEIRVGVKTTLEAAIPALHVHATVPDAVNVLPAVLVIPWTAEFNVAMGRGTDTWELDLLVLVSTTEIGLRQDDLDELVTGAGSKSIRQAIFNAKSLGLDSTDANLAQMIEYGARFPVGEIEHLGARLRLTVNTSGKS